MKKDVSIALVPFENNPQFARVLEHVMTRTAYDFSRLEVLVIDNNTDLGKQREVEEIVSRYKDRCSFKLFKNNNAGQLAQATNKAIELADSKWFVYLCATDTYIYDETWLQYAVSNLSDDDYAHGFRMGGTITPWPNYLTPDLHYHVQGSIFIAFTEFMKAYPYSADFPFDYCDVIHCARTLKLGMKLKAIPGLLAHMGDVTEFWHLQNKEKREFKIAHIHGLHRMP
jgi:glycosyltransferase involved in cell wall biosynthesis